MLWEAWAKAGPPSTEQRNNVQRGLVHGHLLPDSIHCSRYKHHTIALCPSQPLQAASEGTTFLAEHRSQHWPPQPLLRPLLCSSSLHIYHPCHSLCASSQLPTPLLLCSGRAGTCPFPLFYVLVLSTGPRTLEASSKQMSPHSPQVPSWCPHSSFMTIHHCSCPSSRADLP